MIKYKVAKSQREIDGAFEVRKRVFVEEQKVPIEEEIDEYDKEAVHVIAKEDGVVIGTGRLVIEGEKGRIGRMAVDKKYRGQGVGKELMMKLEDEAVERKVKELYLHAQVQAQNFYDKLEYTPRGEKFDECGIMHQEMFKILNS